jgi:hypothetical protein
MENNRERMPDEKLGKFMAGASTAIMIALLFVPHMDSGTKVTGLAFCISGVLYGRSQVSAAKKWREKYGEPTPEALIAIKKSHSVNIFRLLALIAAVVVAFMFLFVALAYCLSKFNAH